MTLGLEEGMYSWIDFLGIPFNHIDHNVIHLLSVQCNPFLPSRLWVPYKKRRQMYQTSWLLSRRKPKKKEITYSTWRTLILLLLIRFRYLEISATSNPSHSSPSDWTIIRRSEMWINRERCLLSNSEYGSRRFEGPPFCLRRCCM